MNEQHHFAVEGGPSIRVTEGFPAWEFSFFRHPDGTPDMGVTTGDSDDGLDHDPDGLPYLRFWVNDDLAEEHMSPRAHRWHMRENGLQSSSPPAQAELPCLKDSPRAVRDMLKALAREAAHRQDLSQRTKTTGATPVQFPSRLGTTAGRAGAISEAQDQARARTAEYLLTVAVMHAGTDDQGRMWVSREEADQLARALISCARVGLDMDRYGCRNCGADLAASGVRGPYCSTGPGSCEEADRDDEQAGA